MQIKLQYESDLDAQALPYIDLSKLPRQGEILDVGAGITLEVLEITKMPSSADHVAVVHVRFLQAAKET